jgi:hypothetical protein
MRDNEYNSKTKITTTKKKLLEDCQVAPGVRIEKGNFTSERKIANEIICGHISMGQDVSPISVT